MLDCCRGLPPKEREMLELSIIITGVKCYYYKNQTTKGNS